MKPKLLKKNLHTRKCNSISQVAHNHIFRKYIEPWLYPLLFSLEYNDKVFLFVLYADDFQDFLPVQKYGINIRLTKLPKKMNDPNGLLCSLGGQQYILPSWMTE